MLDALLQGLGQAFRPDVLLAMAAALPAGLLFGVLPGLSGLTALAILIPFVYGMDGFGGLAFLLTAHAVVYTGGAITAILLGIPGSPPNAATIIDGVPLRDRGRAGEALGAALAASAVGGILGAVALAVLLPVLQPVILLFGSPETFLLSLMGLTFIAAVGTGSPIKGLFAGVFGLAISFVGYEPVSGIPRYWFGSTYLLDGFRLVPLALGLFAIPEILALMAGRGAGTHKGGLPGRQVWDGIGAVFRRPWLTLRSSLIGTGIGIIPGVGGETAPFVAYAAGRQSDRNPERWGTGIVEGVIAPEASNNAKEGGSLVPTLAFGIPGSSGMALLLGGFLVLGLQPGPEFLKNHLDIGFGLVFVLAVANLLGALLMLALAPLLARVVTLPASLLAPGLLCLVVLGSFSVANDMNDVLATFGFGLVGLFCHRYGYNRAALLLGFVLGPLVERYLEISLNLYGLSFLGRPLVLVLIAVTLLAFLGPALRRRLRARS